MIIIVISTVVLVVASDMLVVPIVIAISAVKQVHSVAATRAVNAKTKRLV